MYKIGVICTLCVGIGAGLGWSARSVTSLTGPAAHAQIQMQVEGQAVAHGEAPASSLNGPALDIAQLRAVFREELALDRSRSGREAPKSSAVVDELAPSSSVIAARREALQTIDALVAGGQWGNEERGTFQQKLMLLDPQQAEQALQKVTAALNTGAIQVHTDGAPL